MPVGYTKDQTGFIYRPRIKDHEFANGKPIELITGSNLLYLLKEQAGIDAKIEAPADWVDPRLDLD